MKLTASILIHVNDFVLRVMVVNQHSTFVADSQFTDISIVLSLCMLSLIFVIVFGRYGWKRNCDVLYCLFISVSLDIQLSEGVGIPLTCLTPPHCPKPGPVFPPPYAMFFFIFNDFRWEVIIRLVDIGRIVVHHFFSFSFHNKSIVDIMICFMSKFTVCNVLVFQPSTMGNTSIAVTAYPSGTHEFTLGFSRIRVRSLVFCVVFCRSLFVAFPFTIGLSVLRFTASHYPFGIFKLFCHH